MTPLGPPASEPTGRASESVVAGRGRTRVIVPADRNLSDDAVAERVDAEDRDRSRLRDPHRPIRDRDGLWCPDASDDGDGSAETRVEPRQSTVERPARRAVIVLDVGNEDFERGLRIRREVLGDEFV